MPTRSEAEEHLRIIRSLMEKATIYRAISAPGALVGGGLSVVTAMVGLWLSQPSSKMPHEWFRFAIPWALVFVLTTITNLLLLRKDLLETNNENEKCAGGSRAVFSSKSIN